MIYPYGKAPRDYEFVPMHVSYGAFPFNKIGNDWFCKTTGKKCRRMSLSEFLNAKPSTEDEKGMKGGIDE